MVGRLMLAGALAACALSAGASVNPMAPGWGAEVDAGFGYYKGRGAAGIAAEVKMNGYARADYVVTTDAAIRRDLIDAFHKEGLPVWYVTFCHVAYSTKGMPDDWVKWRMVLRNSPGNDYHRLCMNNPGYIAWKRAQIAATMAKYPFDGVELVEPFWPDAPGPTADTYGCLCPFCKAAFLKDNPDETDIPEFTDVASPRYYKTDTALYAKWVDFRVRSIGRFLNAVLAGVREKRPNVPVIVWTLAQQGPDAVNALREAQGNDAAAVATDVKGAAIAFQTNWMDWSKSDLPASYVSDYRPFIDRMRAASPSTPFFVQVDTGSLEPSRQTYAWMREVDRLSRKMGALGIINYEYFITKSMYDDPPRLGRVQRVDKGVLLTFQKCVDAGRATDPSNYHVIAPSGKALKVTKVQVDGNQVRLAVKGLVRKLRYTVRIDEVQDTPARWLFQGYPAHVLKNVSGRFVY